MHSDRSRSSRCPATFGNRCRPPSWVGCGTAAAASASVRQARCRGVPTRRPRQHLEMLEPRVLLAADLGVMASGLSGYLSGAESTFEGSKAFNNPDLPLIGDNLASTGADFLGQLSTALNSALTTGTAPTTAAGLKSALDAALAGLQIDTYTVKVNNGVDADTCVNRGSQGLDRSRRAAVRHRQLRVRRPQRSADNAGFGRAHPGHAGLDAEPGFRLRHGFLCGCFGRRRVRCRRRVRGSRRLPFPGRFRPAAGRLLRADRVERHACDRGHRHRPYRCAHRCGRDSVRQPRRDARGRVEMTAVMGVGLQYNGPNNVYKATRRSRLSNPPSSSTMGRWRSELVGSAPERGIPRISSWTSVSSSPIS